MNPLQHISESLIPFIGILISIQLMTLKNHRFTTYAWTYGSSTVLYALFLYLAHLQPVSVVLLFLIVVLVPLALLLSHLSVYPDLRFIVSFSLISTLTLILLFLPNLLREWFSPIVGDVADAVVCFGMLLLLCLGRPLFRRYRKLINAIESGWMLTSVATAMIYFVLLLSAAYPSPLTERTEYYPIFFCLCISALALYGVFARFLYQQKQVRDLNLRLKNEKNWHKIAYEDSLTGIGNRMAYMEHISTIERAAKHEDRVFAVMIDLNGFKKINDTHGHHFGDITLKKAANVLCETFKGENYTTFRIGGDEFAVIAKQVSSAELEEKISYLCDDRTAEEIGCSFSIGFAAANFEQNNALETAFIRADNAMYSTKPQNRADAG